MKTVFVSLLFVTGMSMLLSTGSPASAVSLTISPNLQQVFVGESSMSLSCVEDGQAADGRTVKTTNEGQPAGCGTAGPHSGKVKGSSCVLDLMKPFTASYWCGTSSGPREQITIIVTEGNLILDIPALPVETGNDVTLRCRQKDRGPVSAYFYFNGSLVQNQEQDEEHIIHNVQCSDEGYYSCYTHLHRDSPQSFLRVRDPPLPHTTTASTPPGDSSAPSAVFIPPKNTSCPPLFYPRHLVYHLIVFCPYCISTILLVSVCRHRKSGNLPAVSVETTQPVQHDDDVIADVASE
ncbi:uncharacterized protein [Nothobranchius furzeri]|uniref:Ig-like domain-containing protein n=2 Tax=Nothobranchius furzeri TaxID=105023 RepID=A0A8C6LP50_NOTFU